MSFQVKVAGNGFYKKFTVDGTTLGNFFNDAFAGTIGYLGDTDPSVLTYVEVGEGCTTISSDLCGCSNLSFFKLPNSLTSIGDCTFSDGFGSHVNLSYIDLSNTSITSIGNSAFAGCSALSYIKLPNGVTSIGSNAFSGCPISYIKLPNSLTSIGSNAFSECSALSYIKLPNGVTSIGENAFSSCSALSYIDLSNTLITSTSNYTFTGCRSLSYIKLPNGVTSIGSGTFDSCYNLSYIKLPNSLTSISSGTFSNCRNLSYIKLPNGVTSIDEQTFYECRSLTYIKLSSSLTSIGYQAFGYCINLVHFDITSKTTVPTLDSQAFNTSAVFIDSININIIVKPSMKESFKNATNWSKYSSNIVTWKDLAA